MNNSKNYGYGERYYSERFKNLIDPDNINPGDIITGKSNKVSYQFIVKSIDKTCIDYYRLSIPVLCTLDSGTYDAKIYCYYNTLSNELIFYVYSPIVKVELTEIKINNVPIKLN